MTIETDRKAPAGDAAPGVWTSVVQAVDERLGLSALRYPVPRHGSTLAWTLAGLTLASQLIMIAWIILTIIGFAFRGPNWSWVWPWEEWYGEL